MRVEDGCNGRSTESVSDRWLKRYYPRERAIRARLERGVIPSVLDGADEIRVHPRCVKGMRSHYWRTRYEAVLSTLEQRLVLSPLH